MFQKNLISKVPFTIFQHFCRYNISEIIFENWSMTKKISCLLICIAITCCNCFGQSKAVSSAILNLGSNTCGNNTDVTFSLIGNPSSTPFLMTNFTINPTLSNFFSKFIAYNPRDNKIYINDISSDDSRLYIYDMGLPGSFTGPAIMPIIPNYSYGYLPNNFEFDINGDLWSIRSLSGCNAVIERTDEVTGTILFTKTLEFPAGNLPNTLTTGDIVITPNGRMFITMGYSPSKFYEITNYIPSIGNAKANYIQDLPKPCYGIFYMNGKIQLSGTDLSSNCYRYVYDIPTHSMSSELPFQMGETPMDNSSISPSTGLSQRLMGSTNVDSITEDIVYEIYAKNSGNVQLDNFNIIEDLGAKFGAANVSYVSAAFAPGSNPCNMVLNPSFDAVTDTRIFNANQVMSNLQNGYVAVTVSFRATNLISNSVYYATAKSTGEIGNPGNKIIVVDSSNNGTSTAIDPNADGDPGDVSENIPTPFYFGTILPVKFINVNAFKTGNNLHPINWTIAAPTSPVTKFDIEYSEDKRNWMVAGSVAAVSDKNVY